MFPFSRSVRAGSGALILLAALSAPACVSVECDGADAFCDPFALLLYRLNVDPDCTVRGELSTAGWMFFSGSSTDDEIAGNICGLSNGSVILAGNANDADALAQGIAPIVPFLAASGQQHLSIYQASGAGALRRWTYFGGPGANYSGPRIAEAADGGFYLAATGSGTFVTSYQGLTPLAAPSASDEIVLLRFGPDFNLLWYTYLGAAGSDLLRDVIATDEGGVIVVGESNAAFTIQGLAPLQAYTGGRDVVIYKLNASGSVEWYSFFGTSLNDSVVGVQRFAFEPLFSGRSAENDRFVIAGSLLQDLPTYAGLTPSRPYVGGTDMYTLSFDRSGRVLQYAFYGTSGTEGLAAFQVMRSGEIFLGASTGADIPLFEGLAPLNAYSAGADIWLVRLNVDGSVRSHRFIGSSANENNTKLTETINGDLALGLALAADANFGVTPAYANAGGPDATFLRIDSADVIQAQAFYGGAGTEAVEALAPTVDGGVILGGEAPNPGFAPPAGTTILDPHTGTSGDEYYLRVFSDGRTTR
ncbi:MAG: hypothetical protein NXI24_17565 [bacterium]|nr:hypothetical protein [bacterium]